VLSYPKRGQSFSKPSHKKNETNVKKKITRQPVPAKKRVGNHFSHGVSLALERGERNAKRRKRVLGGGTSLLGEKSVWSPLSLKKKKVALIGKGWEFLWGGGGGVCKRLSPSPSKQTFKGTKSRTGSKPLTQSPERAQQKRTGLKPTNPYTKKGGKRGGPKRNTLKKNLKTEEKFIKKGARRVQIKMILIPSIQRKGCDSRRAFSLPQQAQDYLNEKKRSQDFL